ncbi:helix-turn-helix transcriptional regulator [Azospirillum brasilense]|uniref:helix-turn-helix transcriptional regulator n=1 Tax=Azospirillum brasilense TaxID=192 RepID=UPI001EDBF5D3|nr:WYL domain-containing protein [Azospirillum brasilense]UKJ75407.1 WYL domain-containing protein [Azospirillum brasilense]
MRYQRMDDLLRLALKMQGLTQGVSLADVQEEFEVGRRTAERMRDSIARVFPQLEEVPTGEPVKRWRLPPGTLNRLISVSAVELAELREAAGHLRAAGLPERADIVDGLMDKLCGLMPPSQRRRVEPDYEALVMAEGMALRPGPRPAIAPGVLATLREAIVGCRVVDVRYRAHQTGKLSNMPFHPYGLLYGGQHYLVGHAHRSRGMRLLRLANLERLELTDDVFERDPAFELADYVAQSFGIFQEPPVDVVLRFLPSAAAEAGRYRFHPSQELEPQSDGSLLVRLHAGGLLEMAWHLMTWGGTVEILAPAVLRQTMRRLVTDIADALDRTESGVTAVPAPEPADGAE